MNSLLQVRVTGILIEDTDSLLGGLVRVCKKEILERNF